MTKKLLSTMIFTAILMLGSILAPQVQAATTHVSQDVTAYVGSTSGHGGMMFPNKAYSTVAVHQKSYSNNSPIFNFGTVILTNNPLYLHGYGSKSSFTVTDTGDLGRVWTTYWIDIYFGTNTTTNKANADQFGVKQTSYTAF